MKTTPLPEVCELLRLFEYKEEGVLFWRAREGASGHWNTRYAGKPAGSSDRLGRIRVHVGGVSVRAHRIIFKMHHGYEPGLVDHANGDASHNRIENLRAATVQQNVVNSRGRSQRGLPKGVTVTTSRRYGAAIKHNGHSMWLGTFDTIEEAKEAYRGAAIAKFGEFSRFE